MARLFIALPVERGQEVEDRAEELMRRARLKGYDPVCSLDIYNDLADCPAEDIAAEGLRVMMTCDALLMDADATKSEVLTAWLGAATGLTRRSQRRFIILHTKEQWKEVKRKYTI